MPTDSNFTGVWRADLLASRLRGPAPADMIISVSHAGAEVRVEMTVKTAADAITSIEFYVRTTGEPTTNSVGAGQWVSRSSWVGHELLIESDVTHGDRQMHFRDYWSLSADGRQLIMEHRGDDLDGQRTVLNRVVEPRDAGHAS
jgi:hypothetical protein